MSSKAIKLKDSNNDNLYPCPYFPIGTIYMSVTNINPSSYFGGTWEQVSQGRCLVGVDETQTEFNSVKKIGGSKYTERHTHTSTVITKSSGTADYSTWGELMRANANNGSIEEKSEIFSRNGYFGTGDAGNLQPYFCCYIWLRVK